MGLINMLGDQSLPTTLSILRVVTRDLPICSFQRNACMFSSPTAPRQPLVGRLLTQSSRCHAYAPTGNKKRPHFFFLFSFDLQSRVKDCRGNGKISPRSARKMKLAPS